MAAVAAGKLDVEIADRRRKDEIGAMARALEQFRDAAVQARSLRWSTEMKSATLDAVRSNVMLADADYNICFMDLITNSLNQIENDVGLLNQARSSLNEIVGSIKQVAEIVADIANASSEQAEGLEQINKALAQMDEVTQQNSALVEENAAAAKTLEHQSTAMDERVGFFRVELDGSNAVAGNAVHATAGQREAGEVKALLSSRTIKHAATGAGGASIKPNANRIDAVEDAITKAIGSHGIWKNRLRTAIDSGKLDASPVEVAKDNVCQFGQWLYGPTIPAKERAGAHYGNVRKLHAEFHKCAAKVLECVAEGQSTQADALMAGDYAEVSTALTSALTEWRGATQARR